MFDQHFPFIIFIKFRTHIERKLFNLNLKAILIVNITTAMFNMFLLLYSIKIEEQNQYIVISCFPIHEYIMM